MAVDGEGGIWLMMTFKSDLRGGEADFIGWMKSEIAEESGVTSFIGRMKSEISRKSKRRAFMG